MAIALANGGGRPPDWEDFVGIVGLLFINSTISFIEENNAGNAAAALMAGLARRTKVIYQLYVYNFSYYRRFVVILFLVGNRKESSNSDRQNNYKTQESLFSRLTI